MTHVITPGIVPDERRTRTRSVLTRYPDIETSERYIALSTHYGEPVLPKGYTLAPVAEIEAKAALGGQEVPEGLFWFTITTDQVDRANDRVIVQGIKARNYLSNPVILWSHNHELPAIGRGESFRAPVSLPDGRSAILMGIRFQDVTELAKDVGALVRQGFIRTGSIGFIPLSWTEEPVSKYADAYNYTDTVRSYTEWELLEFSICNIPMNPGASAYDDLNSIASKAVAQGVIGADSEFIRAMQLETPQRIPTTNTTQAAGGSASIIINPGASTTITLDATTVSTDKGVQLVTHEDDNHATPNDTPTTMNVEQLAEKAGLTPEQFAAAMSVIDEEKSFAAQMAKRDAMDEIWNAVWVLQGVVCEAVEEHVEGEGTAKTDALMQDFIDAANMIISLIRSLPVEQQEMIMRSVAERREITKAGSVLNAANKEHAKRIYKAAGVCNKSIGEIFESAKMLLESSGPIEDEGTEAEQKTYNDDAPLMPTEGVTTLDELVELVHDLTTEITRIRADITEVKSYTKPELPPMEEEPEETNETTPETEEDDAPVVSIFGT